MKRQFWIIAWIASGLGLVSAPFARADPAVAAISHLEKILNGEVDLGFGADTAISPHVGLNKKSQIKEHLKRMALDLTGGELEPGKIRIDGDLAGVIVHKREGYDPDKVAAFAVALVKREDRWLPAPVTASFENTGISMEIDLRQRAVELERWMLRERTHALGTLRDEQAARMVRDITVTITGEEIKAMTASDMARAFLNACQEKNRLRLLGMFGGLADPLPRDWPTRLRAVEQIVAPTADAPAAWRALTSQDVLRAIVHEETGVRDALFSIGYIDHVGEVQRGGVPAVHLLHIELARDARGQWRINLPTSLIDPAETEIIERADDNPFDAELLDVFPQRLRESIPATPQETPEALWREMQLAMRSDSPDDLLRLLSLPMDDAEQSRLAIGRAARFWWQLRSTNGGRAVVPLAFHHEGDQAMAMVQLFAFREPERTDLRAFHMVRFADGWMWQSTGRQEPPYPIHELLITWRNEQEETWRNDWAGELIKPAAHLETLASGTPADEGAAESLVRSFLAAISAGDINTSLEHTAVLDDKEGKDRLLRNLGYELATQITEIEGDLVTHSGTHWTVVCFRRRDDVNPGMALMPVVATPDGPRILLELDLFVGTRQRDFLNSVALERLEGYAEDEVRADLQKILQQLNRDLDPGRKR